MRTQNIGRRFASHLRDRWRSARATYRSAVDLLLPPRCVLCEADLQEPPYSPGFCDACCESLWSYAIGEHCRRCGMPLPENLACRRCAGRRLRFASVTPLGVYEGRLREAVLEAKLLAGESTAAALGGLLAEHLIALRNTIDCDESLKQIDLVVPVPSYWWRRVRRGTNEAAVLSQVVAQRLRLPEAGDLLVCRRNMLTAARAEHHRATKERPRRVSYKLGIPRGWREAFCSSTTCSPPAPPPTRSLACYTRRARRRSASRLSVERSVPTGRVSH